MAHCIVYGYIYCAAGSNKKISMKELAVSIFSDTFQQLIKVSYLSPDNSMGGPPSVSAYQSQ